jgi:hypothetical protein
MFSDIAQGIPWDETGALRFFLMQALGIMLEDAVTAVVGPLYRGRFNKGWMKVLGYTWVILWLVWASPVWVYPLVRRSTGDPIIPLSVQFRPRHT